MQKDNTIKKLENLGFNFYKQEEKKSNKFIMIPKQFYSCPFYKKYLNPISRELYAWLVDRMSLSKQTTEKGDTSFVDENGYIYLIFSRASVMNTLNISKQTVADAFKILNNLGLIYEKRLGQGNANRIYIGKVRYLKENQALNLIETFEKQGLFQKSKNSTSKKSKSQKSKISTSESKEFRLLKVENLDANNTNNTNTDTNNTDTSSSSSSGTLIKNFEENICKLRKTTLPKFKEYISNYDDEFIKAVIEYCTEISINSFAGFKKVIDNYILKNIITKEEFTWSIEDYRNRKKINSNTYNSKYKRNGFTEYDQRKYTKEQFKAIEQAIMPMVEDVDGEALLKKIIESRNKQR